MADPLAPIINKMLQQVMGMINQASSSNPYYLPNWVVANGYDPYGTNKVMGWDLSITDPTIVNQANQICPTIDIQTSPCPGVQSFVGVPNKNPQLTLGGPNPGQLVITGASNAYMQSMTCDQNQALNLQATMLLSTLPNYPRNLIIKGDFVFTQYCCCSADGKSCSGPAVPQVGTGTFTATFQFTPKVDIKFHISKLAPGVLSIQVDSLTFSPNSGNGGPGINVKIDIKSIPKTSAKDAYNNLAMAAFNSADGISQLIQQINIVLNNSQQLQFMSQALTNVIDGYLRANHEYPFDGSFHAVL